MIDPFTFDPSRVRCEDIGPPGGDHPFGHLSQVRFTYPLPTGETLEHFAWASAGGGGSNAIPNGLDVRAYPIFVQFKETVDGLSAHQRLAWMAAAQKEAADA
jgi:hypothetical protein